MISENLLASARALCRTGERHLLGIVGAPGSGKSTLAAALADAVGSRAAVLPMDGYHLAQAELERLDRAGRKGAPDTFDVPGFVAMLGRLSKHSPHETVYAPLFRRDIEEPIAGAIAITATVELVIVEGNYLLLDGAWSGVAPLLDQSWFLDTPDDVRDRWLLDRHQRFGRDRDAALAWIAATDAPNARQIARFRPRAMRHIAWPAA